jgi:hypothetical protein
LWTIKQDACDLSADTLQRNIWRLTTVPVKERLAEHQPSDEEWKPNADRYGFG